MSVATSAVDLNERALVESLAALGQPPFRARQVRRQILQRGVLDYRDMSDLPEGLRSQLAERLPTTPLTQIRELSTPDGSTAKLLLRAPDDQLIETVSIREAGRHTVCVSSQVGCAMRCAFCASGLDGVSRDLTATEILAQVLHARRIAPITNVVFMGMGEPLANYRNVVRAIELLSDPAAANLSARRITVSTVGIIARIRKLAAQRLGVNLAVSLHAADDETRRRLVPTAVRHGVADLIHAGLAYADETGRRVTFEYTLIEGVNAEPRYARALAALLVSRGGHVNLIPYNPVPTLAFGEPAPRAVREFAAVLRDSGITVTTRKEKGRQVSAACGQLRRAEG